MTNINTLTPPIVGAAAGDNRKSGRLEAVAAGEQVEAEIHDTLREEQHVLDVEDFELWYGAAKALGYGVAPVPAFAMGVVTACVGGIIRDVLANEPSILMRPELYVTAAALASGLYVVATLFGVPPTLAAAVAGLAGFALRGAAIACGLSLPAYGR